MWVQPLRTAAVELVPPRRVEREPRVAVLINVNARGVSNQVLKALSHVVPEQDLLVSRSQFDVRRLAQLVVERGYDTVFCGGGDGTFMGFATAILNLVDQRPGQRAPRFGVLRLGTGNSLAALLNASSVRGDAMLDDVLRARAGEVPGYRELDLLTVEGKRTPFAGLGLDGRLLNDYLWVKERLGRGLLRHVFSGGGGYLTSIALKTVPHYLTNGAAIECEVRNGGAPAYRLAPDGSPTQRFEPGEILYRGNLNMAAAGTIPFYGFNFTMFPFAATRRRSMHLRLTSVSAAEVLANLPNVWQGKWFGDGVFDFHASEAHIRFAKPMPLQIAGDAVGYREEVTLAIARRPVEFVDFTGALN